MLPETILLHIKHKKTALKTPKLLLHFTCETAQMDCGKHYDMSVAQNRLLVTPEDVSTQANRCQQIWVERLTTIATNFA